MKTPTETLLSEIEAFIVRHGMTHTGFSWEVSGDRNLVGDLRAGREMRHSSILQLRAKLRVPYAKWQRRKPQVVQKRSRRRPSDKSASVSA